MPFHLLRQGGFQISLRSYPHVWPYSLNLQQAPWDNKLVRQAANYAIDREGLCKSLLNDTCQPATAWCIPVIRGLANRLHLRVQPEKSQRADEAGRLRRQTRQDQLSDLDLGLRTDVAACP